MQPSSFVESREPKDSTYAGRTLIFVRHARNFRFLFCFEVCHVFAPSHPGVLHLVQQQKPDTFCPCRSSRSFSVAQNWLSRHVDPSFEHLPCTLGIDAVPTVDSRLWCLLPILNVLLCAVHRTAWVPVHGWRLLRAGLNNYRGMSRFRSGRVDESIQDFDRALLLQPRLRPYMWQRGLSLYYGEHFDGL